MQSTEGVDDSQCGRSALYSLTTTRARRSWAALRRRRMLIQRDRLNIVMVTQPHNVVLTVVRHARGDKGVDAIKKALVGGVIATRCVADNEKHPMGVEKGK